MAGTKRWLAALLAGILLFSCAAAPAEGGGRDTVEIQESLVSREDSTEKTLEEHLLLLLNLVQRKEVRNLLQIEDVQTIGSEVLLKVLIWMAQNRPVTMKILAEFGVGESDLLCVGKIWDSAERVQAAVREYADSEDGQSLREEYQALTEDPELREIQNNLLAGVSPENARLLVRSMTEPENPGGETVSEDGPLAREALGKNLDESTFLGSLMMRLLRVLDQNEWASDSLIRLLRNENLWRFLMHLVDGGTELNLALMEEYKTLSADPDVTAFAERTLAACAALSEKLGDLQIRVSEKSAEEPSKENDP